MINEVRFEKMAPFPGATLILLGIGYLLRAESSLDQHRINVNANKMTKEGKSHQAHFLNDSPQNLTTIVGQPIVLLCQVKNLGNRTVSWIRKKDLHILTSMSAVYTRDERFTVIKSKGPEDWSLLIDNVQTRDAGVYECQVNTEPKISTAVNLKVLDIQAKIIGPEEVFVKEGSTISLKCIIGMQPSNLTWYHAGDPIDFKGSRGGVSLETENAKGNTTSKLLITRATVNDSGNYTCFSSKVPPANVMVHVVNGEYPAAMHGGAGRANREVISFVLILSIPVIFR